MGARGCLNEAALGLPPASSSEVVRTTPKPFGFLSNLSPQPPSKTVPGCNGACTVNGQARSCGDRIRWTATHIFGSSPRPCELALGRVLEECEASCAACSLADSHCTVGP